MNGNINLKNLGPQLRKTFAGLSRYGGISFFVLLACLYGFILFRINSLTSVQPDEAKVAAQAEAARIPKVDAKVVKQLQSLEDSSTSVKILFDAARQNPFQ